MTNVVNDLLTAVDSGKPLIILSLDISAAFDMLDHTRLLKKTMCRSLRTHRPSHQLAQVISHWPLQLRLPRKLPFYHCWLYYKSAARLRSWTSALLDFYNTSRSTKLRLQYRPITSPIRWWYACNYTLRLILHRRQTSLDYHYVQRQ